MSMLDNYKVLTITHHNLNVDELGNFILKYDNEDHLRDRLEHLKHVLHLDEIIYLNTCNRVSFICYSLEDFDFEYIKNFFHEVNPDLPEEKLKKIGKFVDLYEGSKAVNHLFEVAASMDSLVVGEREIFRQFRESFDRSKRFGFIGDNLRLLEKATVTAAKEVYANTRIGEKPLSIVSLAVQSLLNTGVSKDCLLYTSPSPRDLSTSRMPSSA